MALTLGGGPPQLSEGKFLLKGGVGCSGSPVMWDRECEVWGQKCDQLCSLLTRGILFLDSSDSPTQLARLRRGRYTAGMELARLPLPGPQRMVFVVLPGAFHRPRGKVLQARRRRAAKAPEMTAARRFRAHPAPQGPVPGPGALLPARLGGGAHSSSRSGSSGGDSSGAPRRAAFQRVCTSMPARCAGVREPGSGGARDARGPETRPRWRTQRGARQLQGVIGSSAPARSSPRRWLSWKGRQAR